MHLLVALWGLVAALAVAPVEPVPDDQEAVPYDPRRSLAPLVDAVQPAVVVIEVIGENKLDRIPLEPRQMFGIDGDDEPRPEGQGSGFIIDETGILLTNHHVIADGSDLVVRLHDGAEVGARVLGSDADLDIAVLKLESEAEEGEEPRRWPHVELADSELVRVGDWVLVMGNTLGLGTTATFGIVSGKGRVLHHDRFGQDDFIQTDAAINQGNSGGPLFDTRGRVIGMNTAIIAGANTVGFAISSNVIGRVLEDLKTRGRVSRGFLGVAPQTLTEDLRKALEVKAEEGVVVANVFEDTPASRAGLRTGDVITAVDGEPIVDDDALIASIGSKRPDEKVKLTIERNRRTLSFSVTLEERPDAPLRDADPEDEEVPGAGEDDGEEPDELLTQLGLRLGELPREIADGLGVRKGVLVEAIRPESPADGRLLPGDVILEVDRKAVDSVDKVRRVLSRADDPAYLLILRNEAQQFVALPTG